MGRGRKKRLPQELIDKAEANGIRYILLYERIIRGWDEERASTQPVTKKVQNKGNWDVVIPRGYYYNVKR
jgi:hypothetical protein